MSIGDLFHPSETHAAHAQAEIVAQSASRWYAAHLLLFIGMLLLVPGFLSLTKVARDRKPKAGYAARLLMLASVGAFSAVFMFEMMLGQFIAQGAGVAAGTALLNTFQSPEISLALGPALLLFFVGTGLAVWSLASAADPFRWPAFGFALGTGLILGEIVLAQVRLSQIGNIVALASGAAFARLLLRDSTRRGAT
jgi:hypothetical protein